MADKIPILVCDDDSTDILIFKKHLGAKASNYLIYEANTEEQIEKYIADRSLGIQAIFMDFYLRNSTGLDWTIRIGQNNFAPVVILTGQGGETKAVELMKAGAFDYIPKDKLLDYDLDKVIQDTIRRWKVEIERDHLLGIAAHEFRGPLAVIMGYTEMLTSYPDLSEEEKQGFYKIIHERSQYLSELISQVLDLNRIERGRIELKKSLNDLITFLRDRVKQYKVIAQKKKISLHFASNIQELPIYFDKKRMEEVLSNMIDNAIKYSESGAKVNVEIAIDGGYAVVRVIDHGQGIKADELQFLFDMFSSKKISSKPTAGEESHGLGLAICKKIIDLHSGYIEVTSAPGKGTCFIVKLPMH